MIEEQLVEVINALDRIADNNTKVEFDTETYNLISWLGDSLDTIALRNIAISSTLEDIANTLKKMEAKMK